MNNSKIIEALNLIQTGIEELKSQFISDEATAEAVAEKPTSKIGNSATKEVTKTKKTEEKEPEASAIEAMSKETLDAMTYNSLKKFAKDRGISATGNRDEITARLLGTPVSEDDDEDDEEEVEEVEEAEEAEEVDPTYAQVLEATSEMSVEELADLLVSVGLSGKGKKESLIDKLVTAVKEGLLSLDDDEDSSDEEVVDKAEVEDEDESEDDEEETSEEDDNTNDLTNPAMTKARKKALKTFVTETRDEFTEEELARVDLVEFLQAFHDTDNDMDDMSDEEVLECYIDAASRLINDDGESVEEGAYELNGEAACCGRLLKYAKETKSFICEHCGSTYEAE